MSTKGWFFLFYERTSILLDRELVSYRGIEVSNSVRPYLPLRVGWGIFYDTTALWWHPGFLRNRKLWIRPIGFIMAIHEQSDFHEDTLTLMLSIFEDSFWVNLASTYIGYSLTTDCHFHINEYCLTCLSVRLLLSKTSTYSTTVTWL